MTNVIPLRRRRDGGIVAAYQEARMNETCPNCAAAPGDYCQHDGHTRIIPCVARLQNHNDRNHFAEPPPPKPQLLQAARDFSEPQAETQLGSQVETQRA